MYVIGVARIKDADQWQLGTGLSASAQNADVDAKQNPCDAAECLSFVGISTRFHQVSLVCLRRATVAAQARQVEHRHAAELDAQQTCTLELVQSLVGALARDRGEQADLLLAEVDETAVCG